VSRSLPGYVHMLTVRGQVAEAERAAQSRRESESSAGVLERADYDGARSILLLARGEPAAALVAAQAAMEAATPVAGVSHEIMRVVFPAAVEAAFALGDLDRVRS